MDGTFQREAANQTRTAQPVRVTLEGLINLMAELDFLRTTKRQEIKEAIKIAKGFGDLSENSEYDEAREEQGKIESRIVELEEMLKNVDLIDESGNTDQVNVGTKVRIFNRTRNKEVEYYLVGSTEANASLGKISDQSPIGKAIIGEKVGRVVHVEAPAGVMELEILEISK
ncbi:MAG: transcription elongation factor GreA [Eubacteriales bacterium]